MKTPALHSAFLAWLALVLSTPAVGHASPPSFPEMPFRQQIDLEQRERDHTPRPAAKRVAEADAGDPRTMRLIYFLPNDRSFNSDVVDSMKTGIRRIQTFYSEQMEANGYGNKTFQFETDDQGEPMVHRVDGPYPESEYFFAYRLVGAGNVKRDVGQAFDFRRNIFFIVVDHSTRNLWDNVRGIAGHLSKEGGFALVPSDFDFATAAHELGHAFGLQHDFRDGVFDGGYIMSFGQGPDRLSACSAGILAVHPYFNPDVPTAVQTPPTIDLVSSLRFPAGSTSFSVQLRVSVNFFVDVFRPELKPPDLHQVSLFVKTGGTDAAAGFREVKFCHVLSGVQDTVVVFDYDGIIPSEGSASLSTSVTQYIAVEAIDTKGNVRQAHFLLAEDSPHHITTLKGPTSPEVYGAKFSPDGTLLAVHASSGIAIWDAATRTYIAGLSQRSVSSVVFSPDGTLLASGSYSPSEANIKLWDVATRTLVATLEGHLGGPTGVLSLSFSPDGALLASGSGDQTIKLWDVATRTHLATLEGHTSHVYSVAFSPDGTLASGSRDGTVKLWDAATRTSVATLEGGTGRVLDVSFSPDGTTLASSTDGAILLWDMATRTQTATLDGRGDASFSADGSTLASGGGGYTVLWDMATREQIATLGHAGRLRDPDGYWVNGVFSPNGALLASVSIDGVQLWDASAWTRTPPHTLVKISGDDQQGTPGAALANPFVVDVRDQGGSGYAGAAVTFAVTAGGGSLSSSAETTDASGRAASTLTLGSQPGTNTVEVSVAGLTPVTFTAVGQASGQTATDFNGDGKTDFVDFFLFADAYGGTDSRFDLDGSGTVDFVDFFKFVDAFDQPGQAKLLALAQEIFGLPLETQLQQNWPNPFNSETVISWFRLEPGPARLEVFSLTGQRVAVLRQGPQQAGYHRLHWAGRDDEGRPMAGGVYLYRLVTAEGVLTRKLTLLR